MAVRAADGKADVSVVIPAHNAEAFLARAIDSALDQSLPPLEVIVVDDGSTDGTPELLAGYGSRIRCLRLERGERSRARNAGMEAARGGWIAFLDADDEWLPAKLERQMAALEAHPEAVLAYTAARNVDSEGAPITLSGKRIIGELDGQVTCTSHAERLLDGCSVFTSTVVASRDELLEVGGFEPEMFYGEDWDLWLRLSHLGPFVGIGEVLACRRTHGRQRETQLRASQTLLDQRRAIFRRIRKRGHCPNPARCDRAEVAEIVWTAMARFETGDSRGGREAMDLARSLDPELRHRDRLLDEFEMHARSVWLDAGRQDAVALAFLRRAVSGLGLTARLGAGPVGTVMARLRIAEAFRSSDRDARRRGALAAVRHDPRWLFDPGVWSMLLVR